MGVHWSGRRRIRPSALVAAFPFRSVLPISRLLSWLDGVDWVDGAGGAVDADPGAGDEGLGAGAGVDDAGDAELPGQDRAVAHRAADVDDDAGHEQEEGRPARVGGAADEDVAVLQVEGGGGVEDHDGPSFGD